VIDNLELALLGKLLKLLTWTLLESEGAQPTQHPPCDDPPSRDRAGVFFPSLTARQQV
jgi:hypothetical protein